MLFRSKANVLYRRLDHDRRRGKYDRARFESYLSLPRSVPYANPEWLKGEGARGAVCALDQGFGDVLQIDAPVGDDEPLVREFFLHFAANDPAWEPWTEWLRDSWVKPLFAEAKITRGAGEPERWASLLSPAAHQALKDRVDIEIGRAHV